MTSLERDEAEVVALGEEAALLLVEACFDLTILLFRLLLFFPEGGCPINFLFRLAGAMVVVGMGYLAILGPRVSRVSHGARVTLCAWTTVSALFEKLNYRYLGGTYGRNMSSLALNRKGKYWSTPQRVTGSGNILQIRKWYVGGALNLLLLSKNLICLIVTVFSSWVNVNRGTTDRLPGLWTDSCQTQVQVPHHRVITKTDAAH